MQLILEKCFDMIESINNKIGSMEVVTDTFDIDASGTMKLSYLSNLMLKCAEIHATQRGWGMMQLNEGGNTWVLSRAVIEFTDDVPGENEHIILDTWVDSVMRLFTVRKFRFRNAEGRVFGYSHTVWAMINRESRKPVILVSSGGGNLTEWVDNTIECPIAGHSKISVNADSPSDIVKVKYSDIDMNGHMNSCRYIEHVLDLFSADFHRKHKIRRFEIAYMAECLCGEELSLFCEQVSNNDYNVEICKNDTNEVACRSKIVFF